MMMVMTLITASVANAGVVSKKASTAVQLAAIPITGTTSTGAVFNGTFDVQRFAIRNGELVAIGTLTGTLTSATGQLIGNVSRVITLDVTPTQASCEILDLVLGPLDLNLLGLMVHLDQVHLNITAVPGPGNLLGNLLCAVAGLLDAGGPLQGLVGLLNNILRNL